MSSGNKNPTSDLCGAVARPEGAQNEGDVGDQEGRQTLCPATLELDTQTNARNNDSSGVPVEVGFPPPSQRQRLVAQRPERPGAYHISSPFQQISGCQSDGGFPDEDDVAAAEPDTHPPLTAVLADEEEGPSYGCNSSSNRSSRVDAAPPLVEGVAVGEESGQDAKAGVSGRGGTRKVKILLASALVVAIIAAAATIAVVTSRNKNKEQGGGAPSSSLSSAKILSSVVESIVVNESTLSDPYSPQSQALEWMANQDSITASLLRSTANNGDNVLLKKEAIVQRYALAVLFFSCSGQDWTPVGDEGSTATHAYWCSIRDYMCGDTYYKGINMSLGNESAPFLSAERHECEWEGVGCYEGQDIVGAIALVDKNLVGTVPDEIGTLGELRILNLHGNSISGSMPMPSSLASIGSSLEVIEFYNNNLNGTLPEIFNDLRNLRHLGFSINQIVGTLPRTLEDHPNLEELIGSFNGIDGTISSALARLPSLRQLDMDFNALTGSLPEEGEWPALASLFLNWNGITGPLPSTLAKQVQTLSLIDNFIVGTLPPELFDRGDEGENQLISVALLGNALTGKIPESVGMAQSSAAVILDGNALTGTIPESVSAMSTLGVMSLGYNALVGTIPKGLGGDAMPELIMLLLGGNKLSGTLPGELALATNLELLDVSRNNLNGSVNFLCPLDIATIAADCGSSAEGALPAEVECDCCQICCSDETDSPGLGCDGIVLENSISFVSRLCDASGWDHIGCGGNRAGPMWWEQGIP